MDRQPRRRAVQAVRAVKAAATATLAGTAIVVTLGGATANPGDGQTDSSARLAETPREDLRCAGSPGKTIVRTPSGQTRAVSFERAWKVYRGELPGTLLVVCPR